MKSALLLLVVSLSCSSLRATDWKLSKSNDHLKIYTAKAEHSKSEMVRVECTVNASVSQVLAAFFDVDGQQKWVYGNKTSRLLSRLNDSEFIYYSEVSVPWPFSNRDFIAHVKATQISHDVVFIDSYGEPAYLPEVKGVVRVKTSAAHMVLSSVGNNITKVEYTIQFDPGGEIPVWVTNLFVCKGPYGSFEKLPEILKAPDYQNASFSFLK
jgi:hypothetical protein